MRNLYECSGQPSYEQHLKFYLRSQLQQKENKAAVKINAEFSNGG